jgi:hypothetical protein
VESRSADVLPVWSGATRHDSELLMCSNLKLGVLLRVNYCTHDIEITPIGLFHSFPFRLLLISCNSEYIHSQQTIEQLLDMKPQRALRWICSNGFGVLYEYAPNSSSRT